MAEINSGNNTSDRKKGRRTLRQIRLDMTPMVDLAFLLLTFFILATTLNMARTLEISYPKEQGPPMPVNDKLANTFLIGEKDDVVYYYPGKFKSDTTLLQKVDLNGDGLTELIRQHNARILNLVNALKERYRSKQITKAEYQASRKAIIEDRQAPFFIIKTGEKSKYKAVVNILDGLNNCEANKYAVVGISEGEKKALEKAVKSN